MTLTEVKAMFRQVGYLTKQEAAIVAAITDDGGWDEEVFRRLMS